MDSGGGTAHCGPVADLVDPYLTKETVSEGVARVAAWLDSHPGRWAMFSEGTLGFDGKSLLEAGFEVSQQTNRVTRIRRLYARLPHPEGESLEMALARGRHDRPTYPTDLPELDRDAFDWTPDELRAACQAAKESLFPVRATRGGRK